VARMLSASHSGVASVGWTCIDGITAICTLFYYRAPVMLVSILTAVFACVSVVIVS
jgi:hypothetical protein